MSPGLSGASLHLAGRIDPDAEADRMDPLFRSIAHHHLILDRAGPDASTAHDTEATNDRSACSDARRGKRQGSLLEPCPYLEVEPRGGVGRGGLAHHGRLLRCANDSTHHTR